MRLTKRDPFEKRRELFKLGQIIVTPTARAVIHPGEIALALAAHVLGNWGRADDVDWKGDEATLYLGHRLFSVFDSRSGDTFWVITEPDQSATTVLLPADY